MQYIKDALNINFISYIDSYSHIMFDYADMLITCIWYTLFNHKSHFMTITDTLAAE